MEDLRQAFGRAIRTLRQQRDWTQEDLALAAGLQPTFISDIERGARAPGLATQRRLADALDVRIWQIFKLAEDA
jgi:transcriptional regulator with XRE-family HTH domain